VAFPRSALLIDDPHPRPRDGAHSKQQQRACKQQHSLDKAGARRNARTRTNMRTAPNQYFYKQIVLKPQCAVRATSVHTPCFRLRPHASDRNAHARRRCAHAPRRMHETRQQVSLSNMWLRCHAATLAADSSTRLRVASGMAMTVGMRSCAPRLRSSLHATTFAAANSSCEQQRGAAHDHQAATHVKPRHTAAPAISICCIGSTSPVMNQQGINRAVGAATAWRRRAGAAAATPR
jgi:hypothetical protein